MVARWQGRKWLYLPLVGAVVILLLAQGCSLHDNQRTFRATHGNAVRVAVAAAPYRWLLRQLGGELVEVVTLGEGAICPESYQPTDAEVSRLLSCQLFFRVGLPFEQSPWFKSLLAQSAFRVVDLRQSINQSGAEDDELCHSPEPLHEHADEASHPQTGGHQTTDVSAVAGSGDHHHHDESCCSHANESGHLHGHGFDPHIWLAPHLVIAQARLITEELCRVDPQHATIYEANYRQLEARLKKLDTELAQKLASINGRRVLVFHPGWQHFVTRYGLTQVAVEQEGKLPSDAELTRLQQEVRQAGAQAIAAESADPSHPAHTFARTLGLEVVVVSPVGENIEETLRQFSDFALRYAF